MSEARPIRVAIVDDHVLIRDAVRLALEGDGSIDVVAEARTAAEAVSVVRATAPDVVVLDYRLPDGEAPEVIEQLQLHECHTEVIVLSSFGERRNVRTAIDKGACAFLTKSTTDMQELRAAVLEATAGRTTLSPDALNALVASVRSETMDPCTNVTERQRRVWRLLALGRTNTQIADELFVSERTVKYHVSNLLSRTGTRTRSELVALAYRSGLMDDAG